MKALSRVAWIAGWPVRTMLLALIGVYRLTLGQVIGGNCRFYPTCSSYAQQAIREQGAARGSVLAIWRILRCSPLTAGGVDHPPARKTDRSSKYEGVIQDGRSSAARTQAGAAR